MSQSLTLEDVLHLIIRTSNSNIVPSPNHENDNDPYLNVERLLCAYDVILKERSINEDKNRNIYKTLLSMSLMPQPTWVERLGALKRQGEIDETLRYDARPLGGKGGGEGPISLKVPSASSTTPASSSSSALGNVTASRSHIFTTPTIASTSTNNTTSHTDRRVSFGGNMTQQQQHKTNSSSLLLGGEGSHEGVLMRPRAIPHHQHQQLRRDGSYTYTHNTSSQHSPLIVDDLAVPTSSSSRRFNPLQPQYHYLHHYQHQHQQWQHDHTFSSQSAASTSKTPSSRGRQLHSQNSRNEFGAGNSYTQQHPHPSHAPHHHGRSSPSPVEERVVAIRDYAVSSGSPIITEEGTVIPGFDSDDYESYKRMTKAFRRWVVATVMLREERLREEEEAQRKLALALEQLRISATKRAFDAFVEGCRRSRAERASLIIALEHWALVVMKKVVRGWKQVTDIEGGLFNPVVLAHPRQIFALFAWISLTLPDRGEWWKQTLSPSQRAALQYQQQHRHHHHHQIGNGTGSPFSPSPNGKRSSSSSPHSPSQSPTQHHHQLLGRDGTYPSMVSGALSYFEPVDSEEEMFQLQQEEEEENNYDGNNKVHYPQRGAGAHFFSSPSSPSSPNSTAPLIKIDPDVHQRLGRLRSYVLCRIAPSRASLPLLEHASALIDAERLIAAFQGWKKIHREIAAKRTKAERARAARLFRVWKKATIQSHRARDILKRVMHREAGLAFAAWVAYCRHRRAKKASQQLAHARFETWSARIAVYAWRGYVHALARTRMATYFSLWKKNARRLQKMRGLVELLRGHSLKNEFACWKAAIVASKLDDELLAGKVLKLKQRTYLRRWNAGVTLHRKVQLQTAQQLEATVKRAFLAWKARAVSHKKCEQVAVHTRAHRVLKHTFQTWKSLVVHARAQEIKAQTHYTTTILVQRRFFNAFRVWADWVQQRKQRLALTLQLQGSRTRSHMLDALSQWRKRAKQVAHRRRVSVAAEAKLRHELLSRSFTALRKYARNQHAEAQRALQAQETLRVWNIRVALEKWKRIATRIRKQRVLRTAVLNRAKARLMAHVFAKWAQQTQTAIRVGHRVTAIVLRKNRSQVHTVFTAWAHITRKQKILTQRLQQMATAVTCASRRGPFLQWKHAVKDMVREEQMNHRALTSCRSRMLRTCFKAFLAYRRERQVKQALRKRGDEAWRNTQLQAALQKWKSHVSRKIRTQTAATQVAVVFLRAEKENITKSVMQAWHAWTRRARSLQSRVESFVSSKEVAVQKHTFATWRASAVALAHHRRHVLDTAFQIWKTETNLSKGVARMQKARDLLLVAACFDTWAEHVKDAKAFAANVASFEVKLASSLGVGVGDIVSSSSAPGSRRHSVASSWDDNDDSNTHAIGGGDANGAVILALMRQAILRWRNLQAAVAFDAWKHYLQYRREKKATLQKAHNHFISTLVQKWKHRAHAMREARIVLNEKMKKTATHHNNYLVALVWKEWNKQIRISNILKAQALEAQRVRHEQLLHSCFQNWKTWAASRAHTRKKVTATAEGNVHASLEDAMKKWKQWAASQAYTRKKVTAAAESNVRASLEDAMKKWKQWAQKTAALSKASENAKQSLRILRLKHAVQQWKDRTQTIISSRAQSKHAETRLRTLKLLRAVNTWKHYSHKAIEMSTRLEKTQLVSWKYSTKRAIRTWKEMNAKVQHHSRLTQMIQSRHVNAVSKSVFTTWVEFAALRVRARGIITRMLQFTAENKLRIALSKWKQVTAEIVHEEAQTEKAEVHLIQQSLQKAFRLWKLFLHARKRVAAKTATASAAVHRVRENQVLVKWRQYAVRKRYLRSTLESLVEKKATTVKHASIAQWKARAHDAKNTRIAVANATKLAKILTFHRWRWFVALQARGRLLTARHQLLTVKTYLKGMQKSFLVTRSARHLQVTHVRLMHKALQEWKERAHVLATVNAGFQKHQYASIQERFHKWQVFTEERKAKRAAIEAAITRFRHRIQSRIMAAWHSWAGASAKYRQQLKTEQEVRVHLERQLERKKLAQMKVLFDIWKLRVMVTRKCRHLAQRFTMKGRVKRLFEGWKAKTEESRHLRASAEAIISQYQLREKRKIFEAFRENVLTRKAQIHFYKSLGKRIFRSWKMVSAAAVISAEEAAFVALAHHERSIHRRIFLKWRQQAIASITQRKVLARAVERLSASKTRNALSKWMGYVREIHHRRIVLSRAQKFFARSLLAQTFTAWRGLCFRGGLKTEYKSGDRQRTIVNVEAAGGHGRSIATYLTAAGSLVPSTANFDDTYKHRRQTAAEAARLVYNKKGAGRGGKYKYDDADEKEEEQENLRDSDDDKEEEENANDRDDRKSQSDDDDDDDDDEAGYADPKYATVQRQKKQLLLLQQQQQQQEQETTRAKSRDIAYGIALRAEGTQPRRGSYASDTSSDGYRDKNEGNESETNQKKKHTSSSHYHHRPPPPPPPPPSHHTSKYPSSSTSAYTNSSRRGSDDRYGQVAASSFSSYLPDIDTATPRSQSGYRSKSPSSSSSMFLPTPTPTPIPITTNSTSTSVGGAGGDKGPGGNSTRSSGSASARRRVSVNGSLSQRILDTFAKGM